MDQKDNHKALQELPEEEMKRLNKMLGKEDKKAPAALKTSNSIFSISTYFRRLRKSLND